MHICLERQHVQTAVRQASATRHEQTLANTTVVLMLPIIMNARSPPLAAGTVKGSTARDIKDINKDPKTNPKKQTFWVERLRDEKE